MDVYLYTQKPIFLRFVFRKSEKDASDQNRIACHFSDLK